MKPLLYITLCLSVLIIILSAVILTVYPLSYKKYIKEAAAFYSLDPALIASVINAESSFRPNAVSDKGAVGLMQVMPSTAEWVAKQIDMEINSETFSETLKAPDINIQIGTYYLCYLLNKFKDERTALIAYNAGEGKVLTWLADGRYSANTSEKDGRAVLLSCPYPGTNKYVDKILNSRKFYKIRF